MEWKFDINGNPVRWPGFFIDSLFNWQVHVRHHFALGHHQLPTVSLVMNANGVSRTLARKVAWAVAASTAAYGVEAIWEGQKWLTNGFYKPSVAIGRAVAGIFGSTKAEDAMRATDTPPISAAPDRRQERQLTAILSSPKGAPERDLLPPPAQDYSSRHQIPKWFHAASGNGRLVHEGKLTELVLPRPRNHTRGRFSLDSSLPRVDRWIPQALRRFWVGGHHR